MLEERRCPVCGETYLPMVETCKKDSCKKENKPLLVVSTLLGEVLDHRYRLNQILGYGGMGVVYRATNVNTQQERAVKVLHPEMIEKEGMLQRFRTEAVAAGKIESDKAVKIVDFQVTSEKLAYLVMEMVEGVVLRNLIEEGGIEYQRAVEIICQICEAVHAAHEKNIIHRDLKPDNVIVKRTGNQDRVKVLDFGIAKLREADQSDSGAPLTKVGTIMGTPQYMSPEQCRGIRSKELKPASDVYSIGIIAYEMLCGRVPFDGQNALELIDKHKHEPPPHLKTFNSSVPISVAQVVMRALAKMPEDRWESAEKLAQELRIAMREARGGKTVPGDSVVTEFLTEQLWTGQLPLDNPGGPASDPKDAKRRETLPIQQLTPVPTPIVEPVPSPNWLKRGIIAAAIMLLASAGIYWMATSKKITPETETQPKTISDEFGEMVLIGGGSFMMGSNSGEANETPVRSVTVKNFYLDKYEVTNQQYKKFVDAMKYPAPKSWKNGRYDQAEALLPVTYVTWNDAVAYAKWAKKRLPLEAEWEYAARSGKSEYIYPWGAEWKEGYANVGRSRLQLTPVGGFANDHNEAGVFDLIGNVSEWVQDDYRTYRNEPIDGCEGCKVFRGGNAIEEVRDSRAARRFGIFPDVPAKYADDVFPKVGFRCARDAK